MKRRELMKAAIAMPFAGTMDVKERIAYIHSCGEPAFYMDRMPHPGDKVVSEGVTFPDGTRPNHGERVICGSCREPIRGLTTKNIIRMTSFV